MLPILKWQQSYQLDQNARLKIKMKYREDDLEKEKEYWNTIKNYALQVIDGLDLTKPLPKLLEDVSKRLKKLDTSKINHSKKNDIIY